MHYAANIVRILLFLVRVPPLKKKRLIWAFKDGILQEEISI